MKHLVKQLFTGKDNATWDIGRLLWFECVQAFICIVIYYIYKGAGTIDIVSLGVGLGIVLGAGGASLGLKGNVEPSSMEIKTDRVTFKKTTGGQPAPDDSDDDTPTAPTTPDAPDPPDDTPTAAPAKAIRKKS